MKQKLFYTSSDPTDRNFWIPERSSYYSCCSWLSFLNTHILHVNLILNTDEQTCLSTAAVYNGYISIIWFQVNVHVITEGFDQLKSWGIVVIKWVCCHWKRRKGLDNPMAVFMLSLHCYPSTIHIIQCKPSLCFSSIMPRLYLQLEINHEHSTDRFICVHVLTNSNCQGGGGGGGVLQHHKHPPPNLPLITIQERQEGAILVCEWAWICEEMPNMKLSLKPTYISSKGCFWLLSAIYLKC